MLPRTAPTGDLEGLDTLILAIVGRDAPYTPLRLVGGRKPRQWLQTDGDDTPETACSTPRVAAAAIAAGVAVVAPLAPDMVTLDLDGCAVPTLLEALDALSVLYGAVLAYRAASGSPNSEHRSYAAPEAARPRFRAAVRALEAMHRPEGVTRWALDDRTADNPDTRRGHGLRLPLSPSLKQGGGPVVPLDAAGHPLSVLEASRMVWTARRAVGLPAVYGYGHATGPTVPETGEQDTPAPSATPAPSSPPAAAERSSTRRGPAPVIVGVGGEFTPTERLLLETVVPEGLRSDAALPAVRAVVRRCGTAWSTVRSLVMSAPVFGKFAAGGEARARAWWEQTAGGYAQWLADHRTGGAVEPLRMPGRLVVAERPAVTPEQTDAVLSWLSAAWSPLSARYGVERAARAHTAALFIGARVMLDGRGLEGRAVAVRDLVQWGAAGTPETASRALADLEAAGVLSLHTDYGISAPLEARRWSVPGVLPADSGRPDTCFTGGVSSSSLTALTGPGCLWLPPSLRALLSLCGAAGLTAASVGHLLRCSRSTGYGYLRRLASAGLVERVGDAWRVVPVERLEAVAGAAPEAAAAGERLEAARARVADDRRGWRRLWSSSVDAAGRVVWRFRHWLRRSASSAASERSADAATCGDSASAASRSSTGPWSGVLRRPVGPLRSSSWSSLSSAVQDALPGLEAPPGGWSSSRCSSAPAVMPRSGVRWARDGLSAPGAGEWPGGPPERLRRPENETANSEQRR